MAKNTIYLDVVVDDNGTTRRVAVDSTRLADAMSRTARNSAEADRNIKGAAQASSNATKNFSKMSQGMGGLVAAYATIAAQVFALSAAYQFLLQAADFRILIEGQKALTQQTGVAYTSITRSIQAATDAQLGYKQAAQAAAIGTAAGLSATMLKDIASYSQTISAVLGRDLEDTFNRLVRGITKAEPELLDELGIVLRLADATSEYARTLGKTANELTAYERTQGVAIFTLNQVEEKYGDLNKSSELSANGIRQLGAAFSELANKILPQIASAAEFLANSVRNNVGAVVSTFGLLLGGVIGQVLPSTEDITRRTNAALEKYSNKIADYTIQADAFARGQLTITKRVQPAVDSLQNLASSIQRVQTLQGKSTSPLLTDVLGLTSGQKFNPQAVLNMKDRIDAEIAKRDDAGYIGKRRDREFVGLTTEQLKETSSRFGVLVTEASKAAKGIEGRFSILGNRVGEVATRIQLRWAQTMSVMQTATAFAVRTMNRLFNTLGYIGLILTLIELGKSAYAAIQKYFADQDKKEESLADRVIGSQKEVDTAKARIQDLERAAKGIGDILQKDTFENITSFIGNFSNNIGETAKDFKEAAASYKEVTSPIKDTIEFLKKERDPLKDFAVQGGSAFVKLGSGIIVERRSIEKQYDLLTSSIENNENRLNAVSRATVNNLSLEILAYAKTVPKLRQYVSEIEKYIEAQDYSALATSTALEEINRFGDDARQAAGAVRAYAEGVKTIFKEAIDSAPLDSTQKRFVNINNALFNLQEAFTFSAKNGTLLGKDLDKLKITANELKKVLVNLRTQLNTTFDIKQQEQNLNALANQLQLFGSESNLAIEILNDQDIKRANLEIAKIDEKLQNLKVSKDIFDIATGNNVLIEAALGDQTGAAVLAAGTSTAEQLATKFTDASNGFIDKYKEENTSYLERLSNTLNKDSEKNEDKNAGASGAATEFPLSIPAIDTLNTSELEAGMASYLQRAQDIINQYRQAVSDTSFGTDLNRNEETLIRNLSFERERSLLNQEKFERQITQNINNRVQETLRLNEYDRQILERTKEIQSLDNQILNTNVSLADKLENQTQFSLNNIKNADEELKLLKEANKVREAGLQARIEIGIATGKDVSDLQLGLIRLQGFNRYFEDRLELQNELNALQQEEQLRQTRLKLLSQENDAVKNLLDIQQEYVSLQNPYLQDELVERLNIQKAQQSILYLQQQINETSDKQAIPGLKNQLELEKAKLFVLQEQSVEINKISQAAQGAFGEGLQQEIANFLKGGEVDIENSFLNIIKSVGEAAADQLSQSITESIMGGIFGEQTPEAKMKNGVVEGATIGAEILAQGVASGVSGITIPTGPAAATTAPGGVPTADPAVTASRSIGKDLRNFGTNVKETFASDAPFLDKLGSIFSADAPWINSMTRGLAGALGGLAVGALSGGGGNAWRNAIIGGVVSGLSFGFSSWLGGLGSGAPVKSGVESLTPVRMGGTASYSSVPLGLEAANGGIAMGGFRAFANGGVVNKPTLGLVGEGRYNEAVVPLPDGKSIPVIMQSGGGDRNNIGININVNSNGQMQGDAQATGERGVAMAQAIQNVVQLELKRQKRPGGLLSPF
jgi:phosphoglycolate phosphatase-like HAD superfamily hydrolase